MNTVSGVALLFPKWCPETGRSSDLGAATELYFGIGDARDANGDRKVSEDTMNVVRAISDLDDDSPVLPGTKRKVPVMIGDDIPDIKSVWLGDSEMKLK